MIKPDEAAKYIDFIKTKIGCTLESYMYRMLCPVCLWIRLESDGGEHGTILCRVSKEVCVLFCLMQLC